MISKILTDLADAEARQYEYLEKDRAERERGVVVTLHADRDRS